MGSSSKKQSTPTVDVRLGATPGAIANLNTVSNQNFNQGGNPLPISQAGAGFVGFRDGRLTELTQDQIDNMMNAYQVRQSYIRQTAAAPGREGLFLGGR